MDIYDILKKENAHILKNYAEVTNHIRREEELFSCAQEIIPHEQAVLLGDQIRESYSYRDSEVKNEGQ